jgi:iron complex outermembrane receptor protein
MIFQRSKLSAGILAALVLASSLPEAARAQAAAPATPIDEVIVTAARRASTVQDLPMAITALSGDALQQQNIANVEDLTGVVPNVLIAGGNVGTQQASFYMRGIPNVGTYVDGIWQVSNNALLTRDFLELDRVEVLRGPQGTLYGRDSTGGSIHLHSKLPGHEFALKVSAQVGNLERKDVTATFDIPLTNTLLTKWTVGSFTQDGWVKSLTTGENHGWLDSDVFRGDLLWQPLETVSLRLIHQKDNQVGKEARVQALIDFRNADAQGYQVGIAQAVDIASGGRFNPAYAQAGAPGGLLDEYENRSASRTPNRFALEQTTLHFDWDLTGKLHFKYMFGDTLNDGSVYNDWGGSEYNIIASYFVQAIELDSHEFQFTGTLFDDKVDWVAGYYTWDQTQRSREPDWAMADWIQAPQMGRAKTLDYATVLASPACTTRTPRDAGYDFTGRRNWLGQLITGNGSINDWPNPCNWAGGLGWVGVFAGNTSDRLTEQTQEGDAFFGEFTYHVSDVWDVTLGYRDHEQDNVAANMSPARLAASIAAGATEQRPLLLDTEFSDRGRATAGEMDVFTPTSFGAETWRVATSYDVHDDVMLYFGYSEGFNSGGVSQYRDSLGPVTLNYAPEYIENIEVGLRADWFAKSLRSNVTYFNTDWLGIQYASTVQDRATGADLTERVLQNSADGKARGLEVELAYVPIAPLTLAANLGFLDTEFTNIDAGTSITSNSEFARAPERTYSLSAQYEWTLTNGAALVGRLQSNYWGEYWRASTLELRRDFRGLSSAPEAGDIWMHNARLTYTPRNGRYEISLWANNLTDEYNLNSGFMHGLWQFDFATVDRPREVGLQLKANF